MNLVHRIESLENELAQLGGRREEEGRRGREYVRIAREGVEEEVAEGPTDSEGRLPQHTVKALFEGTSAIKYMVSDR